ncbi:MAG: GNAT family N-acetyltransferase [Nitrospira sp.]|nr:GNAT family N-acetyltransferase [Nitrospira sp.]
MTDPVIRNMDPDDRESVVQLLGESDPWKRLGYTQDDWNRIFCPIPQARDCYIALLNGQVAGVAILKQKFLLGDYLELLGVAVWARQKGIGGQLLRHIEELVFKRTKNLFVCVSDFNESARAFYKMHGYQEIGPMPNFLIPGSAELLLRKSAGPTRRTDGG